MEHIEISVDARAYDAVVHAQDALLELGDLKLFIKPRVTENGAPGICICFHVRLPDGTLALAQAVTTLALFVSAARTGTAALIAHDQEHAN